MDVAVGVVVGVVVTTLLGVLRFTSPAVRELSYRKGQLWYLGPSTKRYPRAEAWRSHPSDAVPARAIWMWLGAAVVVINAALGAWGLGSWIGAAFVGLLAACLIGMAVGGWRTNRALRPRTEDPVVDVVDRGLLRFSPKVDELIREICAAGGRERLETFDWGDPGAHVDVEELHRRLLAVRDSLTKP